MPLVPGAAAARQWPITVYPGSGNNITVWVRSRATAPRLKCTVEPKDVASFWQWRKLLDLEATSRVQAADIGHAAPTAAEPVSPILT